MVENILKESEFFDDKNKKLIKNDGVVFTKQIICDQIIEKLNPKITEKICEPSVGKGIFVFSLLEYFRKNNHTIDEIVFFIENNLFCFDINKVFINSFKENLNKYVNIFGYNENLNLHNIKCGDFLKNSNTYDVTFGNPPYVRIQNLSKEYLVELKLNLKSIKRGNIDLYYAFLEKALLESKRVGFIIPNSFIKTKSGSFIRNIIKDRVSFIYDNKIDKIWEKISTYTCIVICGEETTNFLTYKTKKEEKLINKDVFNDGPWIFTEQKDGNQILSDLIYSVNGGLATLKDDVFKITKFDSDYCYINNNPIEYGICKKIIKATKNLNLDNIQWFIYPYDKNGKIIEETIIQEKYPKAYDYLKSRKKDLINRDKGKAEHYKNWYMYGRKQGLLKHIDGIKIVLPITFSRKKGVKYLIIPNDEDFLILSGVLVNVKEDKINQFIEVISSSEFYDYCEVHNKILQDKKHSDDIWLSLTTNTIKNFKY